MNVHMVQATLEAAAARAGPVRIYKVQAHAGVKGNEHADEAAKTAALRAAHRAGRQEQLLTCPVTPEPPYSGWGTATWPVSTTACGKG